MNAENWFWLGTNSIQHRENRVVLPHALVDIDLIELDTEVVWAHDSENDLVLITQRSGGIGGGDRFERLARTRIGDEPFLSIPDAVIGTHDGFEAGEALHFATTDRLGRAGCCFVLSSDEADALLGGAQAMSGSVDSGSTTGQL